jgi:hypothetical protein
LLSAIAANFSRIACQLEQSTIKLNAFVELSEEPCGRDKELFLYPIADKLHSGGNLKTHSIDHLLPARR